MTQDEAYHARCEYFFPQVLATESLAKKDTDVRPPDIIEIEYSAMEIANE